jgi:hypothetical protein
LKFTKLWSAVEAPPLSGLLGTLSAVQFCGSLQLLRSTAEQMKQLQDAASQAKAALAAIQAEASRRIADAESAALAQVESYKQKWREEFDKRRKLHNLVSSF